MPDDAASIASILGDTMRIRVAAATLVAVALLTLTACQPADENSSSKPDSASQDTNDQAQTDTETSDTTDADDTDPRASVTGTLPDLRGKDLQAAQDAAQAAGFFLLTSSDATGQDRMQILDRNWVVCSQTPGPGKHPTSTTVNFDSVKDGEPC